MRYPYLQALYLCFLFTITQTSIQAQASSSTERRVAIDLDGFRLSLKNAPLEKSTNIVDKESSIELPMPEGGDRPFKVRRNTLMAPEFVARFPEFRTYDLSAVDDPQVTGHMTVTPHGLLVTVFTPRGLVEISPENMLNPVMHRVSIDQDRLGGFKCAFERNVDGLQSPRPKNNLATNGTMTRTYDLAIVTTGEYGQTHGGTVGTATAVVTQLIGALEDIYEKELAVKFNLLTPRIYLDPNNDPFPSNNTDRTLMAAEAVALNWPDPADYDLGHVLHSEGGNADWGGGVAAYGLCNSDLDNDSNTGRVKAAAWSSVRTTPTGDVDLFAHEVGHQFHMPHTFNGSGDDCDGNIDDLSSYEIGSGTTLMSYNGICSADQNIPDGDIADNYFHVTSLEAALGIMTTTGCATTVASGNTPPLVNANPCGAGTTIPVGTPFRLTGSGTDADGDQVFYTWEQVDEDGPGTPTQGKIGADAAADPAAPLFRSYPPRPSPTRYFPSLDLIKANNYASDFEPLSTVERTINMRLTGRDSRTDGGGIHTSNLAITVSAAGPFEVQSPNGGETLTAGNNTTVTWNVNGTNAFCTNVNIKLSIDGGSSFPYTLASAVANNGSRSVTIPVNASNTTQARIMVECADNSCVVFFDISDNDFTITSDCEASSTQINPSGAMTFPQGDPGLDFDFIIHDAGPVASRTFNVSGADPDMNAVRWNSGQTNCELIPGVTTDYQVFRFIVDQGGVYEFRFADTETVFLYSDPFDPNNVCTNFIGSSVVGGSYYGSIQNVAPLTAYTVYSLVATNEWDGNGDFTVNFSGPGSVYPVTPLLPNTAYTYVAVNTANNQVAAVSATADFTALGGGSYQIFGANYYSGAGPNPAPVNPASWIGQSINQILAGGTCVLFSANAKPVTIEENCTLPVINSVAVTQPSCETAGGTIVVNATGDGALEYSVNNGISWQTDNTFGGLTPGDYNIRVRLQGNPACVTVYNNNPVTIDNAPSAPVINAPTVTQPSCGTPTGTIVVNTTGAGPFEFSVNGGDNWQASNTFTGLAPGEYNIQARLQANTACLTVYENNPVVINTVPTPPTVNAPTVTQPTCATPTGTIVVNATGAGTLEYSVDGGDNWQTNNTFSGLAPGDYNIQVRLQDAPTCTTAYANNPVTLNNTSAPVITAPTVTQPACGQAGGGTIVVNATGTGTLEYSVDGGTNWQTNNTFTGLTPGEYNIQVRLQNDQACVSIYNNNPVVIENLSTTLATTICPAAPMTFPQGDPGLDLSFVVHNTAPVTSHTFDVTAADPEMDYVYWSNDQTTCIPWPGATANYEVFSFMVDQTGSYNFSFGPDNYRTVHVFSDPFDPNDGCMNFIASSEDEDFYYNGILGDVALESCTIYHLVGTNASGAGNTTVSFTGPGAVYPVATLPENTSYTYAAVNTATNQVATVNADADFTSLAGGTYEIFGANYYSGAGPVPPPADPALWVGQTIAQILGGGDCVTFSTNSKLVTVEGGCTAPVVSAPTITQPTCAVATGTIVVNATGGGALEYSVNGGGSWQAGNTFNGLGAGGYNIQVRLQGDMTCVTAYAGNPVTINAAPAAPVVTAPTVTQPTANMPLGTIVVNATGAGTLEYSINNGDSWGASNTFSGLSPGNYNIQVRLQGDMTCVTVYANNPVVINNVPPPGLLVSAAVYLQGPYNAGLMRTDLRADGVLPLMEPYTNLGYQHVNGGGENTQQSVFDVVGSNAIVDWVFLELRNVSDVTEVIATRSALLQADGDVVDVDGVSPVTFLISPVDDYYLVVKHRNHLGVRTAAPVALSGTAATVDFRTDLNQVEGAANGIAVLPDGKLGLYSGDFDHNGQVQNTDYANMVLTLGTAGYQPGDFDLNGQVQNTDLQFKLVPNIGRGQAFP